MRVLALVALCSFFSAAYGQFGNDFVLQKVVPSTIFIDNGSSPLGSTDAVMINNYLFVSFGYSSSSLPKAALCVYNVADPANPTLVTELTYTDRWFSKLLLENNTLYAVGKGLTIFNVGTPATPTHVAFHPQGLNGSNLYNIESTEIDKLGNYFFFDSGLMGVQAVELVNPTSTPVFKSTRTMDGSGYVGVALPATGSIVSFDDYKAYYSVFNAGMMTSDGTAEIPGFPTDVTYVPSLGLAFVNSEPALGGVATISALNVGTRTLAGQLDISAQISYPGRVAYSNGVAMIKDQFNNSFMTVNVSNPAAMTLIKDYPTPPNSSISTSGCFRFFESSGLLIVGEGKRFDIYKSGTTLPTPTITSFAPASGLAGTTVTITGTNFSGTAASNIVKFNGTTATVTNSSTTSITTTVPAGATTGTITVTVGALTATSTAVFTVTSATPPPTITSFTPTKGQAGTVVTITGTNFSTTPANNTVKFNNVTAVVSSSTTTSITTTVPAGATTGLISVTVGGQTVNSASNFVICPVITVAVTSTNKSAFTFGASGGVAPYTYALDGVNFFPASNYNLSTGTYLVTAKDANGCTGTTDFKINGIVECSVTQSSGGQGTTFTTHILGSGSGTVRVSYEMFTIPDQMEIFYDNNLVASTAGLVSGVNTLTFNYTYNPSKPNFCVIKMTAPLSGTAWEYAAFCPEIPSPKVTSFSPKYGPEGATVTIDGYNFSAGTTVKFGTIPTAAPPTITNNGGRMTAPVPVGAITAPLVVSNTFGSMTTASSFTVSPYCYSGATSTADSRIDKVIFASIDNTSPAATCEAYTDYTHLTGFVTAGQTYDLKVTLGTCGSNYTKAVKVFIDWNGNFNFTDAGEEVAATVTPASATREETFSVTVPASLTITNTRMRVVLRETSTLSSITSCGTFSYGETEEYSIAVVAGALATKKISRTAIEEFETGTNFPSTTKSFGVAGTNLGTNNFTVTAPSPFQVSTQSTTGFATSATLTPVAGSVNSTIYVRYLPTLAGTNSGNITVTNPAFVTPSNVAVSGKAVAASPTLVNYALLDNFSVTAINNSSVAQKFRVVGTFLGGNITVTAPLNFEVSLASTYTSSVSITPVNGQVNQQINIRYKPTVAGPHTGSVLITSLGVSDQNVPVNGNIVTATTPTITAFSPSQGPVGTVVSITGTNFSGTPANNIVKFNNVTATPTASTATSLTVAIPATATSGSISVTVAGLTGLSNSPFTVLSSVAPTVTSFTPTSGPVGTIVTITGTSFSATPSGNVVKFNGVTATVASSTPTSITIAVPAGATTGSISVTVGSETGTSNSIFTVGSASTAPTISAFSPESGPAGTLVTIGGTNFSPIAANNAVKFNGTAADVTLASANSLTVVVPVGATTGTISIAVGSESVTSSSPFTVSVPNTDPVVTFISPASGPVDANVTIYGTNFSGTMANNVVKFNGVTAIVTGSTTTSITTKVPAGATTGVISVTVGSVTAEGSVFTVTSLNAPTITSFSPGSGPVNTPVTITGTKFSTTLANNSVRFNGTTAVISNSTDVTLQTSVPPAATTGPITVTVGGESGNSSASFIVTSATAPVINSFSPTNGIEGTVVTITGSNFNASTSANIVKFGSLLAQVTEALPNQLTVVVPVGATTGTITVTVGSETGYSGGFFVVGSSNPTIASFSPTSGIVNSLVIINGTNFSPIAANNIVKFNGVPVLPGGSSTSTTITTSVPPGATTGKIEVIVNGKSVMSNDNFTVISLTAPSITTFNPQNGPVGTVVTITGTNFSPIPANNLVKFNGTVATEVQSSTATAIAVKVPAGATTGKISVTVSNETGESTQVFTVNYPTPTITDFTPKSGPVGTPVVITGTNFTPAFGSVQVSFNGITTVPEQSSATSITALVPPNALSGPISVLVNGQTGSSGTTHFTVTTVPVPTISDFTPKNGVVGTPVTITGTNYSLVVAENTVKFNGTAATVLSSTATSITTSVPTGATTGKITVTVNGLTVTSNEDFVVNPCTKPPKPTITATGLDTEAPTLTSSAATGNQWFRNGTAISSATNSTLSVTQVGSFTVQVTVTGGCVSDASDPYVIVITGDINQASANGVRFYPNPAADFVAFEVSDLGQKSLRLHNGSGQVVGELTFEQERVEVSVSQFASGLYYFVLTTNSRTTVGKFLKK